MEIYRATWQVWKRWNILEIQKQFVGKKPKTTYRATLKGREAFKEHLNALEKLLKGG